MTEEDKKFEKELYKKWFKAGSNAGFISITPWWDGSKFVVDVGKVNPDNNAVTSSTKCFVDAVDLTVYLKAVANNTAEVVFPKRTQCPSPESFVAFGGSGDIARVFKIHWWGAKEDNPGNGSGFAWKCGHFAGTVTGTGAIQPNFSEAKSVDMIKITRLEMHEIALRCELALVHMASKSEFSVQ